MKKAFYIVFAFYFLSLALKPCGDKDDCQQAGQSQTLQADHNSRHADEICTPFCACSCCATPIVFRSTQPLSSQVAVINTIHTVQKEAKISSAITSIWQPPKLS